MAKTNINFNNSTYQIDDSALSPAISALRNHLSTTMSGTGATINLNGASYNVDTAKLSAATNDFTSHLATIAGSGAKVMVNGREYGIDSTKLQGAVSSLHTAFGNLASGGGSTPDAPTEERLDGDGAEYYTLAPTALSFRSTAPLNELQEVQINGVTVDPSNYTLEEGSTIVTFPIDYLKTLDVGNYEVNVVSDSKTVKGDFTVAAPELNEYGFYYNQPYAAYVDAVAGTVVFFIRENGTIDFMVISSSYTEVVPFTLNGNKIIFTTSNFGTFNLSISSDDGKEIYCEELATQFKMGDESVVADSDYIYIYNEISGGYEVAFIDKTKSVCRAIKTGVNGIDTVALFAFAFADAFNITIAPVIPNTVTTLNNNAFVNCTSIESVIIPVSVTHIGSGVFYNCKNLSTITYEGTVEQWNAITFESIHWYNNVPATHIQCSDGQVAL